MSRFLKLGLSFLPLLALASCNDSNSGGGGAVDSGVGTVNVALADAASDEIDRFEVNVKAIDLVKRDGAVVHTLPRAARVDFADLVQVAELVNAASVPAGTYPEAEITLDFAGAAIHLAGAATGATVLDAKGQPLSGAVKLKIQLDGKRPLVVLAGVTRFLTIDFDLDASTTVDSALNTVTVSPVLVAEVELERHRIHRVRGQLDTTDADSRSFVLQVRPFRLKESVFGTLRVHTVDGTSFEINGVAYEGAAGFQALAALPRLTAVVAVGEFVASTGQFVATDVLAGSSASGGALDVVQGHVASRNGNTLTLVGAKVEHVGGIFTFNTNVTVELDPAATRVNRQYSVDLLNIDAISVGQRITAFGSLGGSPDSAVLSETQSVRLLVTKLTGSVKAVGEGSLSVDVQRFDFRPVASFDFAGTGPAGSDTDADPANYEVNTGDLSLTGLEAGSPVRIFGFVTPFGSAPPDFGAASVVDVSDAGALLEVVWKPDSDAQFGEVGSDRLEIDLADSPLIHHVIRAGHLTDLSTFTEVGIEAEDDSRVLFAIKDGHTVTVHKEFSSFVEDLTARLEDGKSARRVCALGHFDDTTGTLGARAVSVVLKSASG